MKYFSDPVVQVERRGSVTMFVLDRPDRLNAMTATMAAQLNDLLAEVAVDDSVRAVVLTGTGRGFCAGGDMGDISEVSSSIDVDAETAELVAIQQSSALLREMPKPTIAAVNGAAAGSGMSWACAADIRIAGESALFRTAFLSAGLSGDFGLSWTLPRIVGPARARELYLFNEKVRADRALELGLVSRVVPDDQLREAAWALAEQLAGAAPMALRMIKENLNRSDEPDFATALGREARNHTLCSASDDCTEAATAFLERRAPVFVGH